MELSLLGGSYTASSPPCHGAQNFLGSGNKEGTASLLAHPPLWHTGFHCDPELGAMVSACRAAGGLPCWASPSAFIFTMTTILFPL